MPVQTLLHLPIQIKNTTNPQTIHNCSVKNMIKTCCHVTQKITLMLQNLGSPELQSSIILF